jgi:hypothetical protein
MPTLVDKTPSSAAVEKPLEASAAVNVPERLQVLTEKANFWANAMSIEHDRLQTIQQLLGYPVVVITAATGVTAFTQLDSNPAWSAILIVSLFAFLAAALAAVQTHGNSLSGRRRLLSAPTASEASMGRCWRTLTPSAKGPFPTTWKRSTANMSG